MVAVEVVPEVVVVVGEDRRKLSLFENAFLPENETGNQRFALSKNTYTGRYDRDYMSILTFQILLEPLVTNIQAE